MSDLKTANFTVSNKTISFREVEAPLTTQSLLRDLGRASSDKETRDLRNSTHLFEVGKGIRQGDVYIIRINDEGPTTLKNDFNIGPITVNVDNYTQPATTNQLVSGVSLGSRHVVTNVGNEVQLLVNPRENNPLVGPVIKAKKPVNVGHPEHAEYIFPAFTYQVIGQMDVKTRERVAD